MYYPTSNTKSFFYVIQHLFLLYGNLDTDINCHSGIFYFEILICFQSGLKWVYLKLLMVQMSFSCSEWAGHSDKNVSNFICSNCVDISNMSWSFSRMIRSLSRIRFSYSLSCCLSLAISDSSSFDFCFRLLMI